MTEPSYPLELSRYVPAAPSQVFDAWLDPVLLARFLCPAPGVVVREVHVDPQVGGDFSLVMVAGETHIPIEGTYTLLHRPHRLEFQWRSAAAGSQSVVELQLTAEGSGTRLRLLHRGLPTPSSRSAHDGGWQHILQLLPAALTA